MQKPTKKTPDSKCFDLTVHAVRMFGKFPDNKVLTDLGSKLAAAGQAFEDAHDKHFEAVKAILPTRVDVKFENLTSDRRIRLTQQKAEMVDGKKAGKIGLQAFPEGSTPIVRLVGESQVKEMTRLVGQLEALAPLWPEAVSESQAIAQCRDSYAKALEGRTQAGKNATALRAVRNVAKEMFLTTYAEVVSRVEAEFPRDSAMQELFFDDVRSASTAAQAEAEEDASEAEAEAQATPAKTTDR